jgi:hypothetical protein
MSEFERKFGKYAVRDLSLKLIILYLAGYALYYLNSQIIFYMTLNPYAIVHGQIWRIFSWLLIPPSTSNLFFVAVMMFFYYSIGTSLERVWGTWRYNVFIFTGILLTVAASFVWMGFSYLTAGSMISSVGAAQYFGYYSMAFSTYYINMGIFFAYALTFPDAVVLMFFIIPMKVKWLGLLDVAYLLYEFIGASSATRFAILATFANIGLLYWRFKGPVRRRSSLGTGFSRMLEGFQGKGGNPFGNRRGAAGGGQRANAGAGAARRTRSANGRIVHRCAICGRTNLDNPDLEFRYCSKCEGGMEYCQDHLFTHVHVKEGEAPHMKAPGEQ